SLLVLLPVAARIKQIVRERCTNDHEDRERFKEEACDELSIKECVDECDKIAKKHPSAHKKREIDEPLGECEVGTRFTPSYVVHHPRKDEIGWEEYDETR